MEQFGVLTLGSRLKRLSDYLFVQVQAIYLDRDVPISSTYFPILRLLQNIGGLSVVEIAERLNLSHPAVSKQITKMVKEGLLEKVLDEQDHRRSVLRLSTVGSSAMKQVDPILVEMKTVLEDMVTLESADFMAALSALEKKVLDDSLAEKVLDRLGAISIVPLEAFHYKAFHDLNMAWLREFFPDQITEYDIALLENPQQYLLDKGASIWVATRSRKLGESVLGTIVFMPSATDGVGEILKLSVAKHCQGKGIGQKLLSHLTDFAQSKGVSKLTLETASSLLAANALYKKNGFVEKPWRKRLITKGRTRISKNH